MIDRFQKLRGQIIAKYGTQGSFAEALNTTETTISRKMNGTVGFSYEDIIQWCDMLDINKSEIGIYFFDQEVKQGLISEEGN